MSMSVLAPPRAADDDEIRVISLTALRDVQDLNVGDEIEVLDLYNEVTWFGRVTELDRGAQLVLAREMFSFEF